MSFLYKATPVVKKPPPPPSSDANSSSAEEEEVEAEEEEEEEDEEEEDSFAAKKLGRGKRSAVPESTSEVAAHGRRGAAKKACVEDVERGTSGGGKGIINLDDSDGDEDAARQIAKQRAVKELEAAAAEAEARVAQSSSTAGAGGRGFRALSKKAAVEAAKEAVTTGAKLSELHSILTKIEGSRASKKPVDVDIIDDDDGHSAVQNVFVAPKILTAAEREAQALSTSSANLANILGSGASSSSSNGHPPQAEHLIKLKMRLNGKSESKMKFNPKEAFSSIKGKFAKAHEIAVTDILKFEFDGEAIEDDETPEALEMEDEYVIDVKIAEAKFAGAVDARARQKLGPKAAPPPLPLPSSIVIKIIISADVYAKGNEDEQIETKVPTRKTITEVQNGLSKAGVFKENVQLRFLRSTGEELDTSTPISRLPIADGDTLRVVKRT